MQRACAEYKRWSEAGFGDVRFSINVSSHQISQDSLRHNILRALWDYDVPPSALGIGVSLDDFGTGFSSLADLKSFPVDTIKIDQSFVRDLLVDADDASITEAILSIAEKLRLRVVAEGVELTQQRDFLAARGCREMQGFLFSPAVPGDEFLKLLARGPILR